MKHDWLVVNSGNQWNPESYCAWCKVCGALKSWDVRLPTNQDHPCEG